MRLRNPLDAFLDAVARDRRPPRFPASDEEAEEMRAATLLRAGQPGADSPQPEFVEKLERRLRTAMNAPAEPQARRLSRRALLGGAAAATAAAVGAGVGVDRLFENAGDTTARTPSELLPQNGSWVDVAAVEDVPVGRPLRFTAGNVEGYMVNHGGGRMQAVSAMCTHMACTLVFNSAAQRLDCPCHDAWFGLDGKAIGSRYPYALPSLPTVRTRVAGGRIEVFSA